MQMSTGEGPQAKRAHDARYNASAKGRARHRRYNQSEKGLARYKRYYDLNSFELNFDRDGRRRRRRIAEWSALLYGEDVEEVLERLGHGSSGSRGTPTERRKRMEELQRLVDSRKTAEEREREAKRQEEMRASLRAGLRFR